MDLEQFKKIQKNLIKKDRERLGVGVTQINVSGDNL